MNAAPDKQADATPSSGAGESRAAEPVPAPGAAHKDRSAGSPGRSIPVGAWLLLLACLLATLLVALAVRNDIDNDARTRFAQAGNEIALKMRERMGAIEFMLRGAAGLFATSDTVSARDWHAWYAALQAHPLASSVQAISWSPWISAAHLPAWEAQVRRADAPEYAIRPEGRRAAYAPVQFIEPLTFRNRRALGFDNWAEPERRASLERARDTGLATLTGKTMLQQETSVDLQAGSLMFVPVYRNGMPTDTVEQRRAAVLGWVAAPFRMSDFMQGLLADWEPYIARNIEVAVHDGPEPTEASRLFTSDAALPPNPSSPWYATHPLEFFGHRWTLAIDQGAAASAVDYDLVRATAAAGLVISVLIFGLRLAQLNMRTRARHLAEELTAGLRANERALSANESRWKLALDSAGLGVFDWNIPAGRIYYSPRWKAMLGYPEEEVGDTPAEWERRLHPDDAERAQSALQRYLAGAQPEYDLTHRLIGRDGTTVWVRSRGMIIARDDHGKPVRMLGTHYDVTPMKAAEARTNLVARLYAALSAANAVVLRCHDESEMVREICAVIVTHAGMRMAWVGMVDSDDGAVRVVAAHGAGTDYLDNIHISARADEPAGRGPTGTAIRESRPVWVDNFRDDPGTKPWHERAQKYGWAGSAALPIRRAGKTVGALTFYSTETGFFTEETRKLLEEIVASIGFALDKLDNEAVAHQAQANLIESEQRFRGLLNQTITAIYVVQDQRVVFANPRFCEVLGYPIEQVIGRDATTLFGAGNAAAIAAARDKVLGGARSVQLVLRVPTANGEQIDLGLHGSLAVWNGANAIIIMAQDITERKRAEDRIASYVAQLENVMTGTLEAVARMVEMRDPYTAGHQRRVALVAAAIGHELGWSEERCRTLELAGMVHDIGKISIPAELLAKPSRLSEIEYEIIKTHAESGYEILKDIDFPQPIAEIIREHHERPDGTGYPRGLKGDEILPEARVLAVADVLESMASHRPYRAAMGMDKAVAELEGHRGTLYDATVIDAALRLIREKGYRVPE